VADLIRRRALLPAVVRRVVDPVKRLRICEAVGIAWQVEIDTWPAMGDVMIH
jgi:hypothetical protein